MKDPLLLTVLKFLESRVVPGKPLLLGYSGGPDSKALLYLLRECCRILSLELHLAHIDHGWREESQTEALELRKEAEDLGLHFHLKTLDHQQFASRNLEEQGRQSRLDFFSQIYTEKRCQALILGHHADDQAEVVLKRVFEGASLFSLGGLTRERVLQGMNLWRPLLGVQKKIVLEWLKKRHLTFIVDPTNCSSKNLRGKMRQEILPLLSQAFGKEITHNLCWLGEEAQQLREYFSHLNRPIIATLQKASQGFYLDLTPFLPISALQLRYLLKECLSLEGVIPSREILNDIVILLLEPRGGKKFMTHQGEFCIKGGYISFSKK